jgi:hypothetical protein
MFVCTFLCCCCSLFFTTHNRLIKLYAHPQTWIRTYIVYKKRSLCEMLLDRPLVLLIRWLHIFHIVMSSHELVFSYFVAFCSLSLSSFCALLSHSIACYYFFLFIIICVNIWMKRGSKDEILRCYDGTCMFWRT